MNKSLLPYASIDVLRSELHQLDKDINLLEDRIFEAHLNNAMAHEMKHFYERKRVLRGYELEIIAEVFRRLKGE